ncbi:unnamed protein product, partial [Amoebophrya sp. A120]
EVVVPAAQVGEQERNGVDEEVVVPEGTVLNLQNLQPRGPNHEADDNDDAASSGTASTNLDAIEDGQQDRLSDAMTRLSLSKRGSTFDSYGSNMSGLMSDDGNSPGGYLGRNKKRSEKLAARRGGTTGHGEGGAASSSMDQRQEITVVTMSDDQLAAAGRAGLLGNLEGIDQDRPPSKSSSGKKPLSGAGGGARTITDDTLMDTYVLGHASSLDGGSQDRAHGGSSQDR